MVVKSAHEIVKRGRDSSARRPGANSLFAVVLVLGSFFLAHGLQCAAGEAQGPAAMSHTMATPGASDSPLHGHEPVEEFLASPMAPATAGPVGAGRNLDHAGGLCVAVLIAGAVFWLLARRTMETFRHGMLWSARWLSAQLHAAARWRPPMPGLTVLCVSRT